jgi:hypothetical protein
MRRSPGDNLLEPNRLGRLNRLMRHRQKRSAMILLEAHSAGAGIMGGRTRMSLAQQSSLRRALERHHAAENAAARESSFRPARLVSYGDGTKPLSHAGSFGAAVHGHGDTAKSSVRRMPRPSGMPANSTLDATRLSERLDAPGESGRRLMGRLKSPRLTGARTRKAKLVGDDALDTGKEAARSERQTGMNQRQAPRHHPDNPRAPKTAAIGSVPAMTLYGAESGDARKQPVRSLDESPRGAGHRLKESASSRPIARIGDGYSGAAEKHPEGARAGAGRNKAFSGLASTGDARRRRHSTTAKQPALTINFEPSLVFRETPDQATKQSILDALSRHSHELILIIEQEMAKSRRVEFLG